MRAGFICALGRATRGAAGSSRSPNVLAPQIIHQNVGGSSLWLVDGLCIVLLDPALITNNGTTFHFLFFNCVIALSNFVILPCVFSQRKFNMANVIQ